MNKYSKQKLNKRNKNIAKQTKQLSTTFNIDNILIVCFTTSVNEAFSPISSKFSTESMPKCTHISLYTRGDHFPTLVNKMVKINGRVRISKY